jgi:hypothetical protein
MLMLMCGVGGYAQWRTRGKNRAAVGPYEQVSIKGCLTGTEEGELTANNIGF